MLLVWCLPMLVGSTPLRDELIRQATRDTGLRVTVGATRLGWLSPLEIRQVVVSDQEGGRLAEVSAVRSQKTLLQLLVDRTDLGQWTIEQPRVEVITRRQSSNLEDMLGRLAAGESSSPSVPPRVTLLVTGGQVDVRDAESGDRVQLSALEGQLRFPAGESDRLSVQLKGSARTGSGQPSVPQQTGEQPPAAEPPAGSFELVVELALADTPSAIPAGRADLRCGDLDLSVLAPVLARWQPDLRLAGQCNADAQVQWSATGQMLDLRSLDTRQVVVRCPSWLGPEELRLPFVRGQGGAALQGDQLTLRQMSVDGGLARLDASGNVSLAALTALQSAADSRGAMAAIDAQQGRIVGSLDLAAVAAAMPRLLRVREDTTIETGVVQFELVSDPAGGQQTLAGRIATSDLAAVRAGQRLAWRKPLQVDFQLQQTAAGISVERLLCECSFLQLAASGTPQRGTLEAAANLDQLLAELQQFLDLREIALRGNVRTSAQWHRDASGIYSLAGKVTAESFELVFPGFLPWREPRMELTWSAAGRLDENLRARRVDAGRLELTAGDDYLVLALTEPLADLQAPAAAVSGTVRGRLESWQARLQTLLPLAGYDLAGKFDLEAAGRWQPDGAEIISARLAAEQLRITGGGLFIAEPQLEAGGRAAWQRSTGRVAVPELTLATSAVAVRGTGIELGTAAEDVGGRGELAFRGDLGRLLAWLQDPQVPATARYEGQLEGKVTLAREAQVTQATGEAVVSNLIIRRRPDGSASGPAAGGPNWPVTWQEPRLAVSGQGQLHAGQEQVTLANLELDGRQSGIACRAQGTLLDWSRQPTVDLAGELDYDLALLVGRLRPLVGPQLQLAGREQRPFRLQGPLWPAAVPAAGGDAAGDASGQQPLVHLELQGQAALGWQTASYYGLEVGPGQFAAQLQAGVVNVEPLDLVVSQGRLTMTPHVDLRRDPALLVLAPGPLLQQVQITPEMCRTWMKFIAPLLADVTRAEGQFSADLQQGQMPLGQPQQTTAVGTLLVHAARVGPGPLAQQLLGVAEQVQAVVQQKLPGGRLASSNWISMPQQSVEVRLVDGRVYHRGLQLVMDDVLLVTEGSVGLDETISIEAQVPIRDHWVEGRPWLNGLRGQVLRVPIRGTLSSPRVDGRAVQGLASQALQRAAGQALEQELGKGLRKLFGAPQQ